ncbi:MAG: DUF3795 domain-containing protein [Candidatus Hodarchaeota archaeon]
MDKMIVYCGINCLECPAYIATQRDNREEIEKIAKSWSNEEISFVPEEIYCDGCNANGRIFSWCEKCDIRRCCRAKEFENCAYCEEFICDKLNNTFEKTPSARINLEKICKSIKKQF